MEHGPPIYQDQRTEQSWHPARAPAACTVASAAPSTSSVDWPVSTMPSGGHRASSTPKLFMCIKKASATSQHALIGRAAMAHRELLSLPAKSVAHVAGTSSCPDHRKTNTVAIVAFDQTSTVVRDHQKRLEAYSSKEDHDAFVWLTRCLRLAHAPESQRQRNAHPRHPMHTVHVYAQTSIFPASLLVIKMQIRDISLYPAT